MHMNRYVIIIGAMKAGTSSLFYYLDESPHLHGSAKKETHYFSNEKLYANGLGWYQAFWDTTGGKGDVVRLEASPQYAVSATNAAKVAGRVYTDLGASTRFVFIARDPLDRLASHIRHDLARNTVRSPEPNRAQVEASAYHRCTLPFVERFGREQVCVVTTEGLERAPREALRSIERFLDIPAFAYTRYDVKRNTHETLTLPRWIQKIRWSSAGRYVDAVLTPRLRARLRPHLAAPPPTVRIDARAVYATLKADIDAFEALHGIDTSLWRRWNAARQGDAAPVGTGDSRAA